MRLRTCAFSCAFVIAASSAALSPAYAADLPASPYPPPAVAPVVYNPVIPGPWTGFYVGGNLGYGWTNTIGDYTLVGNLHETGTVVGSPGNLDGALGGFQLGYNWQTGNFLIGGEVDIQGSGQNQTFNAICGTACTVSENAKLDWFSTFRGRAGIAIKDVLFYGTGGFAWTRSDNAFSGTFGGIPTGLGNLSRDSWGWTAGGGIEWMFWYGWSAKLEYLYLGNTAASNIISIPVASGGGTFLATANASDNIVRAGVNYHIGYPVGGGWPSHW